MSHPWAINLWVGAYEQANINTYVNTHHSYRVTVHPLAWSEISLNKRGRVTYDQALCPTFGSYLAHINYVITLHMLAILSLYVCCTCAYTIYCCLQGAETLKQTELR